MNPMASFHGVCPRRQQLEPDRGSRSAGESGVQDCVHARGLAEEEESDLVGPVCQGSQRQHTILVVATLIVSATYQAVLQPSEGLYPPNDTQTTTRPTMGLGRRLLLTEDDTWKSLAGQMVMEKDKYRYYMPCNTFSFALSVVIMIFVVPGSPVFLILHLCLVFMCISYLLALDAISHYTVISHMIYFMSLYAILGAYIMKLLYYLVKALLVDEDLWLQGLSVKVSNCASVVKWFYTDTAMRMKKQHNVLLLN